MKLPKTMQTRFTTFPFVAGLAAGLLGCVTAVEAMPGPAPHKVQASNAAAAEQVTAAGGQLIADYGAYKLYALPQLSPSLLALPGVEIRDDFNLVQLNTGAIDTSRPEAQALRVSAGDFAGKRMHLVQFAGPIQPGWLADLEHAGVQIVTYIPENAYLVYGTAQALGLVQALAAGASPIQWDGPYLDSYKIHPDARTNVFQTDQFAVQLVADAEANPATVQLLDQYKLEPFKRQNTFQHYVNIIVRLAPGSLDLIAASPDVVSIQPYVTPTRHCERQDQIVAGNITGNAPSGPGYLAWLTGKGFSQAQFTASGFVADVTDSGIDNGTTSPNHPGLHVQGLAANPPRVAYNRLEGSPNPGSTIKGCDGHGTLNSHVVAGYNDAAAGPPHTDDAGFHYGLGVCPFVRVGSSVIFDPDWFTFPNYANLQSRAYRDGARVSNNSWGANVSGAYNVDAQEYDALVRDARPAGSASPTNGNQEMVIVFSAGNAGPTSKSIGTPGSAKNVLTVGAAEDVQPFGGLDGCRLGDNQANSTEDIASFSSRGPCADGRLKPEIVAPGTHVTGGVAQAANPATNGTADVCFNGSGVCGGTAGNIFYPAGQEFYTASSGTSHSAPGVVGGCALLRQYFINNYSNTPSPAMTKAYLVNSARYMTGNGANDKLWSNSQGMGEMNLGFAFDGVSRILRDEQTNDLFTGSGQVRTFTGLVAATNTPFRVTVSWTDAPGNTAGNAYNNNLDLTVTIGGVTYKGNVFGTSSSVSGGSADARNNTESVFLPAGVSGFFTVTISAVNINSDGVPGNGIPLDQDFALVVYNAIAVAPAQVTSIQPTNLTVLMNQPASFTVAATGTAPLSYQWQKNGVNIAGATSNVFSLASAQTNDAGVYSAIVTNAYASAASPGVNLTVIPTVPLPFALNNSNVVWTTNNLMPWYGQTTVSHDGVAAAQSYFIGNGQQTDLRTTVAGPATLSFWWKISSQTNADIGTFLYGATEVARISGEVDWQYRQVYLPTGSVNLQWTYAKDTNVMAGADALWVDQVSVSNGATAPFIVTQPADQISIGGAPVRFAVEASGTPPLGYQWRFNGTNISGATASAFSITSPRSVDNGAYSVLVTSAFGSILSSNAILGVVPFAVSGDNSLGQLNASLGATNPVIIASGGWHALAADAQGRVVAWGDNYDGQCNVPASLSNVVALAGGGFHSLALSADGTVSAWGANDSGQATPPADLSNVTAIAAGAYHSLALLADGTVVGWGDNSLSQVSVPAGLNDVVAIAAGGNHSLALRADGSVVAWGDNSDALGLYAGQSDVPDGLGQVMAIGAGDYHSLAILADGSVACWGDNTYGQSQPPVGLGEVIALAGGGAHTVALKADHSVVAWGADWSGQCDFAASLTNVLAVAAGNSHSLLLLGGLSQGGPQLVAPRRATGQFSAAIVSQPGRYYRLEYISSVADTNWVSLPLFPGNGSVLRFTDPTASGPQRYYRLRQY